MQNTYAQQTTSQQSNAIANEMANKNAVQLPAVPVLQRALKGRPLESFTKWLTEHAPDLAVDEVARIIAGSANLKEAKAGVAGVTIPQTRSALRTLVDELLASYPKEDHQYILLGNSPALLTKALQEQRCIYSNLPLGGLTDMDAQIATFGNALAPGTERQKYDEYHTGNEKLQIYLRTFFETEVGRVPNLVVIDYTKSGVSAIVAADLLTKTARALGANVRVKLFTFSEQLPDDQNALMQQTDYDIVAEAPLGTNEKLFVALTEAKAYKENLGLTAFNSLTLNSLNAMDDASYSAVLDRIQNPEGQERLQEL